MHNKPYNQQQLAEQREQITLENNDPALNSSSFKLALFITYKLNSLILSLVEIRWKKAKVLVGCHFMRVRRVCCGVVWEGLILADISNCEYRWPLSAF